VRELTASRYARSPTWRPNILALAWPTPVPEPLIRKLAIRRRFPSQPIEVSQRPDTGLEELPERINDPDSTISTIIQEEPD
jgi:hypothetical protein